MNQQPRQWRIQPTVPSEISPLERFARWFFTRKLPLKPRSKPTPKVALRASHGLWTAASARGAAQRHQLTNSPVTAGPAGANCRGHDTRAPSKEHEPATKTTSPAKGLGGDWQLLDVFKSVRYQHWGGWKGPSDWGPQGDNAELQEVSTGLGEQRCFSTGCYKSKKASVSLLCVATRVLLELSSSGNTEDTV